MGLVLHMEKNPSVGDMGPLKGSAYFNIFADILSVKLCMIIVFHLWTRVLLFIYYIMSENRLPSTCIL